jgi:hypothetical protein
VDADHRSAHPNIPGVPWWGAVLVAITATAIGFAFDAGSGNKELGMVFGALYAIGCVIAVLAVRQSGIFTAVIQPPLILFVSVPGAYFLFHGGQLTGVRDTLINCGYPLIERFPLMFFTSAAVLLIGMARWYRGMSSRRHSLQSETGGTETKTAGLASTVAAKVSSLFARQPDDGDADVGEAPARRRPAERPARTARTAAEKSGRPTRRTPPPRSRHTRPPEPDLIDPPVERPRRTRNYREGEPPAEPRRRPRPSSRRSVPPPERRSAYERPERPERRRRYDDYEPLEPHGSNGNGAGNGTHHPISRVRYRGAEEGDDRAEYRTRPRRPRAHGPEAWEYDV